MPRHQFAAASALRFQPALLVTLQAFAPLGRRLLLLPLDLLLVTLKALTSGGAGRLLSALNTLASRSLDLDLPLDLTLLARLAALGAFGTLRTVVGFLDLGRAAGLTVAIVAALCRRRHGRGGEQ